MSTHFSTDYPLLQAQAKALLEGEDHPLAAMANLSALISQSMESLNWAGFYLMHRGELLLGPFQGKPACVHIALNRGVCGAAASSGLPQLVPDVHAFPGHIACDCASCSELVIPIRSQGRVIAVLDLDSPLPSRFSQEDLDGLSDLVRHMESALDWSLAQYTLE
ncbi:MAG: GAF domain-containing protein [Oscillospiraceae bacterium]|nr:GAF domain-containing protein [Oscillospiraceae bacterium]